MKNSYRNLNTLPPYESNATLGTKNLSSHNLVNNSNHNNNNNIENISFNSNQHDDDIDQVFNEYYAQKGYDLNAYSNNEADACTNQNLKSSKHFKGIFGFLFKKSSHSRGSSKRKKTPFSDYPFEEDSRVQTDTFDNSMSLKATSDENDILKSNFDIFAFEKKINKKGSCETLYLEAGNVIKNMKRFSNLKENNHRVSVCTLKSLNVNNLPSYNNRYV